MNNPIFVGIDVSKKDNHVQFLNGKGDKLSRFAVPNNQIGVSNLVDNIKKVFSNTDANSVIIGLESTSVYGDHLAASLRQDKFLSHVDGSVHIKCGYSQVQRIMHTNGIKAGIKSKYKPQTTKVDPNDQAFPNLLNQQFNIEKSNKVWLSDITYIRVNGKWIYLAAVMDLGRRKIVGWALGTSPNASLTCRALKQALLKEQPNSGLIHHSDRGSQYTSKVYRLLLDKNGIVGSMSRESIPDFV